VGRIIAGYEWKLEDLGQPGTSFGRQALSTGEVVAQMRLADPHLASQLANPHAAPVRDEAGDSVRCRAIDFRCDFGPLVHHRET
jgi:hypothetical protein